jgi:hypothetical protein
MENIKFEIYNLNMKPILVVLLLILAACSSTNVTVSPSLNPAGKIIYIEPFKLVQQQRKMVANADSVCRCTAQAIERAMIPFLQQKGFTVITANDSIKPPPVNADFVLTGSGTVHVIGSSTFVESLSLEVKDQPMNGTLAVASFKGVSIRAERAGEKIGGALIMKMK